MSILDKISEKIIKKFANNESLKYADLCTVVGLNADDKKVHPEIKNPYILTTENNEYLSVFEIQGAKSAFGKTDYLSYIDNLSINLSQLFSKAGHKLSFFFERDLLKNKDDLNELYKPHISAMKRLSIDISSIIKDEASKLSAHYSYEKCYGVLYSSLSLLDKDEIDEDMKKLSKELEGILHSERGQNPLIYALSGMKILHDAIFWKTVSTLKGDLNNGLIIDVLDVKQIGLMQKRMHQPNSTPLNWELRTMFDRNIAYDRNSDVSEDSIFPSKLKMQILSNEIDVNNSIIECDGLFYKSAFIDDMPLYKVSFQKLFLSIPRAVPYRIKFDLIGGCDVSFKVNVLSILRFIPSLKRIAEDLDFLVETKKTEPVIRFAIEYLTWGIDIHQTKRNISILNKAVQSWGVTTVSESYPDCVIPYISSIPALAQKTSAEIAYSPLKDALHFLPFERPASVWNKDGIVFYLTEDGKLFPWRIASHLQTKHTEMITGTPGSGKSVLLNRNNLAVIYLAQKNLPFMTIVDKGLSAKGIYDLLVQTLPENKKNQISHLVLENNKKHRVNFLETQLGSRYLTDIEKVFVIQMLSAFCVEPEKGTPPNANDVNSILSRLVDIVYKSLEHEFAKKFEYSQPIVNEALEKIGVDEEWLSESTWFDVVDILFENGYIYESSIAHRQAMPILDDFQSYLQSPELKADYSDVNVDGSKENILNYIGRSIRSASSKYPLLADITNYDYSAETRIIIVDVMNVLGSNTPEGQLQSGIMFLFARHLATKNYFLPALADSFLQSIHPRYREYHKKRIDELSEETKHISYDECHNFRKIHFIQDALNTSDLEDRKFGVRTVFSSQYVQHMPDSVVKSVNSLFMMRLANGDKEYLESLGITIPNDVITRFNRLSGGASKDGSGTYFLAIFKTTEGNICHILKNTVGVKQLWALTSTMKDRKLREYLYKKIGVNETVDILAERFPTSTAVPYFDSLSDSFNDDDESNITLIEKVANELIKEHAKNKGNES